MPGYIFAQVFDRLHYGDSLSAIGVDPKKHDIRFVEDDWESPTLGAWGLGWEVWLNGMEITQFTYFQQAGGKGPGLPWTADCVLVFAFAKEPPVSFAPSLWESAPWLEISPGLRDFHGKKESLDAMEKSSDADEE